MHVCMYVCMYVCIHVCVAYIQPTPLHLHAPSYILYHKVHFVNEMANLKVDFKSSAETFTNNSLRKTNYFLFVATGVTLP